MFRGTCLALLFAVTPLPAQFVMEPGPKSPEESRRCIQVRPGFTVELMAAEPLVMDPIAFAWGPDGKFWVVEMGDYPLGVDGKNRFGGKVKFLTRSGNDGPYEKSTLFLDNLGYPTGVTPWKKGVIVTCAPEIFYAEDTDGDGKADKKDVLFSGFVEGNQQHRVNGLVYGLDGWYYGANGDSGGVIKSHKTGKTVNISGRDFRIKPAEGLMEAVTGQTQFGRCRDDWGNWFGCNNSRPLFHFVLEDHYLRRNPHVIYPSAKVEVVPGPIPVFPASKTLPRFNDYHTLHHFTSACGLTMYRDDLFGPEFATSAFISEPVHNLVHRTILEPKGATFTSRRADDEKDREFLASTDVWFRPAMLQTGPDGALWIADMYRYVIEHPQWIPKEWQAKLDLRAGHDLGRIYRVVPMYRKPRPFVRLDQLATSEVAKSLGSMNGWTRDAAQQILIERQDSTILEQLLEPTEAYDHPRARIHVAATIEGLLVPVPKTVDQFNEYRWKEGWFELAHRRLQDLVGFDPNPAVRRCAVAAMERLQHPEERRKWNQVWQLGGAWVERESPGAGFRLQLACSFGSGDDHSAYYLAKLLRQDPSDPFLQAAVWSSISKSNWEPFIDWLLSRVGHIKRADFNSDIPAQMVPALVRMAYGFDQPKATAKLLEGLIGPDVKPARFVTMAPLLDALDLNKIAKDPALEPFAKKLSGALTLARTVAADSKAPLGDRALALRLLGRDPARRKEDRELLAGFLTPQMPDDLQGAAAARLGQITGGEDTLFRAWKSLGPAQRAHALDALLSRGGGVSATLDALEQRVLLPQDLDAARRQRLLQSPDGKVRERARKLFAAGSQPDRARIVEDYKKVLATQTGDAERGHKVFTKSCATCHQLGGQGQQVGQDLNALGDKSVDSLLIAIFDPNRAVEPRFLNYVASTKAGLVVTGILAAETGTGLTILSADGKKHELLRQEIDELAGTGLSLMPEGLERDVNPQDIADLFAYLQKQWTRK